MTLDSRNPLSRLTPQVMAIYLSLALVALHLILLLGGLLRQNAARNVEQQLQALQSNVEELNASELAELERLQASQEQWEARVVELEAQLPAPRQPFPVYEQARGLSLMEGAEILQAQRQNRNAFDSAAGPIIADVHSVSLEASLSECLNVASHFEAEGGPSLAIQSLQISPDTDNCNMTIATVARTGGS